MLLHLRKGDRAFAAHQTRAFWISERVEESTLDTVTAVAWSQYHLAVAGGLRRALQLPYLICRVRSSELATHPLPRGGTDFMPQQPKRLSELHSKRSRTVATKTIVPTRPMAPATTNGVAGASFHSNPPIAAAGVIDKLRIR